MRVLLLVVLLVAACEPVSAARRLLLATTGSGGGFVIPAVTDFYGMFNGQDGDGEYHVFEATTTDAGATWTPNGTPVLSASGSDWVSDHVKDPWIMPGALDGYVAGYDGTHYRIGRVSRATTSDPWDYDDDTTPSIDIGAGGADDDVHAIFPCVVGDRMWYTGYDGSRWRVMYATTADGGDTWTKVATVLTPGSGGSWDDEGTVSAMILRSGNTGYLYYGGTSDPDGNFLWQGGLATFDWDDPTGTYTKDAGNPVLINRNTDEPDSSQDLTVSSSSTSALVEDSSLFHIGEPVVLADGNSTVQVTAVAALPDATHVTLADPAADAYALVNGARIRPLAYLSVQPRGIVQSGTTWVMLFVAFQPVADLTVVGNKLWEGSQRATAPSRSGPWTYDYAAGLLIPFTGNHAVSAENMHAVPAP